MKPWVIFFSVVGMSCLIYPPLLGFCSGVAGYCFLWWMVYKGIGG
jgi:hypothetical protein